MRRAGVVIAAVARNPRITSASSSWVASARRGDHAALMGSSRSFHASHTSFGFLDGMKQSWGAATQELSQQKQEEGFKHQVNFLVRIEKCGLKDLLQMMQEGAELAGYKGWRKHIPGTSNNPQIKEIETHERIVNNIPPQFHHDTGRLRGSEKLKVLQAANCTNQELNKTLNMLKEIQKLHSWLRKRAEAGKTLPTTPSDMMRMMMDPAGGMSRKMKV